MIEINFTLHKLYAFIKYTSSSLLVLPWMTWIRQYLVAFVLE